MTLRSLLKDFRGRKDGSLSAPRQRKIGRHRRSHIAPDRQRSLQAVIQQSQWANLPPELLLDVIQRIEATQTTWPGRRNVVACASVCKSWREITQELVKTPEECGMLTFPISLKQPGPRESPMQCFIKRERATSTYHLYLGLTPATQKWMLENTSVEEVLKTKGERDNSVFWCRTNDTVYNAVKLMTDNNVGSLVVLKPGEQNYVAGIITERDYLRKMIVQERNSKSTKVGEIMTEENKLVTVTSDTNILQAMQLMTDNHIRHMPVIDAKIVGMLSIVDVIRAVVDRQIDDVKHLNDFIKGDYY